MFLTYSKDILHCLLDELINIVGPGQRNKMIWQSLDIFMRCYKISWVKQHSDSPGFRSSSSANAKPWALLLLPRPVVDGDFVVWSPMKREGKMGFEGFILQPVANRYPQGEMGGGGAWSEGGKNGWGNVREVRLVPQCHRMVGRDIYLEDRDSPMKISLSPRTGRRWGLSELLCVIPVTEIW